MPGISLASLALQAELSYKWKEVVEMTLSLVKTSGRRMPGIFLAALRKVIFKAGLAIGIEVAPGCGWQRSED